MYSSWLHSLLCIFCITMLYPGLTSSSLMPVCRNCADFPQSDISQQLLKRFCKNESLINRCCFKGVNIIGLDASNCNMTSLDFIDDHTRHNIEWLSIEESLINVTIWPELRSMDNLKRLVVTENVTCGNGFNNSTVIDDARICSLPFNKCGIDDAYCPKNSHCRFDGPGLAMCLCNDGWNSYRCLKKDGFAMTEWIVGISATAVVICITLRIMQRNGRKAGKAFKEKKRGNISQVDECSSLNTPTSTIG